MKVLPKSFYKRDPAIIARELLGKILVRSIRRKVLSGRIVETEAYYGEKDPASRAYKGKKSFNRLMWEEPGRAFIYMVHGNWLFNVIAHPKRKVGGVLIRAMKPMEGIEIMKRNRRINNIFELTNGPGKLSKALKITKKFNGMDLTKRESKIYITDSDRSFEISSSHRIGVSKDLPQKLRFFIKGNRFVSRR